MAHSSAKTPRGDGVQVARLLAQGDLDEALAHARDLLAGGDPDPQIVAWAAECEALLEARILASVGGAGAVLEVRSTSAEQQSMPLSPAQGFLLSFIDGYATVDEIADASGLARLEALRGLARLVETGAVCIVAS